MTYTLPAIAELRAIPQWLGWRWEKVKGKDTKVPYVANNGRRASVADPTTWMPYAEAVKAYKKAGHVGLGIVVTAANSLCGIDLDHCRDPKTGAVDAWAVEKVKALNSYTEITPSKTGLRVWIKARLTVDHHTQSMVDELGAKTDAKIEIYDQKRYFTVTENHLPGTPDAINERGPELDALCAHLWPRQQVSAPTPQVAPAASLTVPQVIQKLKAAKNSAEFDRLMAGDISEYNNDDSRADEALCFRIAWYTHDPQVIDQVVRAGERGKREKWNRADYRDRTISKAVATVPVGYRAVAIAPNLPDAFWNARLSLRTIRQAAHSRGRSADAVLGALLTRVSAGVPHPLRIPPIVGTAVPLCLFDNVIGPPGSGKSSAYGVAVELHPLDPPSVDDPSKIRVADRLPIGSGEGLVEVLFDTRSEKDDAGKTKDVKYQALYNAAFYVDEGSVLSALGNRAGSVLLPTLRTIFTGGPLGQTNASKERRRIVPAGHYAIGVCVAFQAESAGAFLEDEAAGTPQRFLWFSAIDPSIPNDAPPWPGDALPLKLADFFGMRDGGPRDMVVADSIRSEVRAADGARNRGEVVAESLQAHADLIRLKVAALLAILDGRLAVNDEDWQLATQIKATSDGVLEHVQEQVRQAAVRKESQTSQRLARRQVVAVSAVDQHRIEACAERIRKKVKTQPGITVSVVRRDLTAGLRDAFEDGLDYAVAQKWVVEKTEAGQGGDKRSLYPGPGRSSES